MAAKPSAQQVDAPAVVALQKRIRGEALTDVERPLLATATRKPLGAGIPHADIMAELEERRRAGR
jgi:hypothetical protein